jgi:hypothetical protein
MAAGDHYTAVVNATFYGQLIQNKLHFRVNGGSTVTPQQAAIDIRDGWVEQVRQRLPSDVSYNSVTIYDTEFPGNAPYNLVFQKNGAQAGDNQLVPFACWVLQFKTALGGPTGHGRCFIPGVLKGFHVGGILQSGGITVWTPPLNALIAKYCEGGTGPLTLTVFHSQPNFRWLSCTNIVLRNTMGAQRNRNIGVGS